MGGCVGVWVVLWWVSSPHIRKGLSSSPRFWPSVQVCMSLCGFPAVSSHSPKNMHIRRLHIPPGCECVSCDELDLSVPVANRRPSLGCHKTHESIPERPCLYHSLQLKPRLCFSCGPVKGCALKTPLRPRPQVTYFNVAQTVQLWRHPLRKNPLPPSHHSPSFSSWLRACSAASLQAGSRKCWNIQV